MEVASIQGLHFYPSGKPGERDALEPQPGLKRGCPELRAAPPTSSYSTANIGLGPTTLFPGENLFKVLRDPDAKQKSIPRPPNPHPVPSFLFREEAEDPREKRRTPKALRFLAPWVAALACCREI
jgi:hypothetical protein